MCVAGVKMTAETPIQQYGVSCSQVETRLYTVLDLGQLDPLCNAS